MELVEHVDATTERGVWAVHSESATVYLLDTRSGPRMMRLSTTDSHSQSWWDNTWAPLVDLVASPQLDRSRPAHDRIPDTAATPWVLQVGSRHKWTADPGGHADSNEWWWWSRLCTSIQRLDDDDLAALLAEHARSAVGAVSARQRHEPARRTAETSQSVD